jgi:hypothetical protein
VTVVTPRRPLLAALLLAAVAALPLGAQATTPAAPAAQPATPAATRAARADTAGRLVFEREVYRYPRGGRRDPFASLIATGDIRPIFNDLVLSGIIFDPTGRNSMATLRDVSTGDLYRARVGAVFGRIRVTSITRTTVQFAIDEFGFTRQESLSLNVPAARTP